MSSNLSCIGFGDLDEHELFDLLVALVPSAKVHGTAEGEYRQWRGSNGEEIWIQTEPEERVLLGFHPHFAGKSCNEVRLETTVRRRDDQQLDGGFYVWADPSAEGGGAYPYLFDSPCFLLENRMTLPEIALVQVSAFAHRIEYFADEAAFEVAQGSEPGFASRSFIPIGLFKDEEEDEIRAHAKLTGVVLEAARLVNPITAQPYFWALVESFGGTYDVVAEAIFDEAPAPGAIVDGIFWMSGRIVAPSRLEVSVGL